MAPAGKKRTKKDIEREKNPGPGRGRPKGKKMATGRVAPPEHAGKGGREKPGFPGFEPTELQRHQVRSLVGFGVKHEDIIQVIVNPVTGSPISTATLHKHFKPELREGSVTANSKVAEALYKKAISPDHPGAVTAAIFWLKARAGWSERTEHLHDFGKNVGVMVAPALMAPDDWIKEQRSLNGDRECPVPSEADGRLGP